MTINGGAGLQAWNGESCPSIHAATHTRTGLKGREMSFNNEAHSPKRDRTNKSVIRLAGLRLMLVESDARKAIDAIESGRIDLARVYLSGVIENVQNVYLKDVEL